MQINFLHKVRASIEKRVVNMPEVSKLTPRKHDFCDIFKCSARPTIISEIKYASPALGRIYKGNLDTTAIARNYLSANASAISIVTEPNYFHGNIQYLADIRKAFPKSHILLKDFILNKKQIAQAYQYGANAVLLIVGFLSEKDLTELYTYAISIGITPIIEVHNKSELEKAVLLRPRVIGINNRDLQTLKIDLDTSRNLIKLIPDNCYALCESGINQPQHIQEMQDLGFRGFLIGSALMQYINPGQALNKLLKEFKHES